MCLGCWQEEGRPFGITDAVKKWAPVFREIDPYGAMHIVVDDWNLDDDNLKFCRNYVGVTQQEIELIDAMLAMTIEERWATAILSDEPDFDPAAHC